MSPSKSNQPCLKIPSTIDAGELKANDKPRVIISLDRSWLNLLGIGPLTFYHLVRHSGGIPLRVDYGRGPEPEDIAPTAEEIISRGHALVLSGGVDMDPALYGSSETARRINRRRDRFELALINQARLRNLPILGICRGCQLVNVGLGGTLKSIRHDPKLRRVHRRICSHPVQLRADSYLAKILRVERIRHVRSMHGQVIDKVGKGLRIAAFASDGVPEAVELAQFDQNNWFVGLQWHPELMFFHSEDRNIFIDFILHARMAM